MASNLTDLKLTNMIMENKKQQVEMMTKALLSRCSGIYSQEALGNEIMDFADSVVKLLAAPDVSNQRELLLAYNEYLLSHTGDNDQPTTFNVDAFLASNSC